MWRSNKHVRVTFFEEGEIGDIRMAVYVPLPSGDDRQL